MKKKSRELFQVYCPRSRHFGRGAGKREAIRQRRKSRSRRPRAPRWRKGPLQAATACGLSALGEGRRACTCRGSGTKHPEYERLRAFDNSAGNTGRWGRLHPGGSDSQAGIPYTARQQHVERGVNASSDTKPHAGSPRHPRSPEFSRRENEPRQRGRGKGTGDKLWDGDSGALGGWGPPGGPGSAAADLFGPPCPAASLTCTGPLCASHLEEGQVEQWPVAVGHMTASRLLQSGCPLPSGHS